MSEPTKGQRLTLSQIVEKLLARGGLDHAGVTLSRNAKGETQIEVVVRTDQPGGIETVEQAEQKAADVFDRLRRRFPLSSGYVGATGVLASEYVGSGGGAPESPPKPPESGSDV